MSEKNNFKKELSIRKEIVDLEAIDSGKNSEEYFDALNYLGNSFLRNDEYKKANLVLKNLVEISEDENPENLDLYLLDLSNSYSWLDDRKNSYEIEEIVNNTKCKSGSTLLDIGSGKASELLGGEGVLLLSPGFTVATSVTI